MIRSNSLIHLALQILMAFSAPGMVFADEARTIEKREDKDALFLSRLREMVLSAPVEAIEFSPDGRVVTVLSRDEKISIWRWRDEYFSQTLQLAPRANTSLTREPIRFSPDGRYFVACHGGGADNIVVRIWDTQTWHVVHDIVDEVRGGCTAIDFSPNSDFLIRSNIRAPNIPGDTLHVYKVGTWEKKWAQRTVPFYPFTIRASPNGKEIAVGGELSPGGGEKGKSQLMLFDLMSGEKKKVIGSAICFLPGKIEWSPDGGDIAAIGPTSKENMLDNGNLNIEKASGLLIFDSTSGVVKQSVYSGSLGFQIDIKYSPNGKYILKSGGGTDGQALGLQILERKRLNALSKIKGDITALAISNDGNFLAYGESNKLIILKLISK